MMAGVTQDQWLALAKTTTSPLILELIIPRLGSGAESYLIDQTGNSNRLVANDAIGTLGNLPKSQAIVDKLTTVWQNDPNELIRASALRSLVKLTQDEALVNKAWATNGFRDEFRQFALGWWQSHKPDLAREKCLEALAHPISEPVRVTAINILGGLKDKTGETRVYDALTTILSETSFGARFQAIMALSSYGNPDAIKLLEPLKTNSLVFFRQAAEGAIANLSSKKS